MYKNASIPPLTVTCLKIFANGGKILLIEAGFFLNLVLAMRESATTNFQLILARYALQPVATEFGLNLEFPGASQRLLLFLDVINIRNKLFTEYSIGPKTAAICVYAA